MSKFDDAKELLAKCKRFELRDHAFGDTEISWFLDQVFVAEGYFAGGQATVCVMHTDCYAEFEKDEARELRKIGIEGGVERNDETGPEEYQEGVVMPGLTPEGVFLELTKSNVKHDDYPG